MSLMRLLTFQFYLSRNIVLFRYRTRGGFFLDSLYNLWVSLRFEKGMSLMKGGMDLYIGSQGDIFSIY
jgi:hypothetical protein